jgi:transcription elongation factor GreA
VKIDDAKQLAAARQFDKLEDLWPDMITEPSIGVSQFLAIADLVREAGNPGLASLLLELLSDYFETQQEYEGVIQVQKHLLRYDRESPQIRQKLIATYRRKYKNSIHLDDYLELSGLSKDGPIMKALQRFEDYLKYDIGNRFYFDRYGMGRIVDVIPEKKEIVVDFEKKKKHFLTIDVARGLLTPITPGHFLYSKYEEPERLRSLASEQPEEIVLMILRSFREPMTASMIKGHLEGIVEATQLNKFWEKARKDLEKHDNIRVSGRTAKTYSYVESAAEKESQAIQTYHRAKLRDKYLLAEEYAKKLPGVFKSLITHLTQLGKQSQKDHPGIALEILMLFEDQKVEADLGYSVDDLLQAHAPEDILRETSNPQNQARIISYIKTNDRSRWRKIATDILFATDDFGIMDTVVDHMKELPERLNDVYQRILAVPREYPRHFLWMLRKIEAGDLSDYLRPNLIPKFIDSIYYMQGVKATVKKILTLGKFDELVARSEQNEAMRIHDSVINSSELTAHEKSGYLRILEHYFPSMVEQKTDIIYTTEAALTRRKKELEHILTVEIPANKKEIGRAREFGDLSENFEYKAAKEKQEQLYAKVTLIESELQKARVIDPRMITADSASIGTTITLQHTQRDSIVAYTIMGRWDTDLSNNIISNEAPLAQSIIGKRTGDTVKVEGAEYRIIEIVKAL